MYIFGTDAATVLIDKNSIQPGYSSLMADNSGWKNCDSV